MYSVKIKNNIQNLFSVLDSTVPGSSPYAVLKTVSNSDNGFGLNVNQGNINPVTISLIQGSTDERYTIGTTVTSGNYRYAWFYKTASGAIQRQIANINFSNGFVVNSLPANTNTKGYVSYNHPDSSVYVGSLRSLYSYIPDIPICVTIYDTNTIPSGNRFTCTQIGVLFLAYANQTGGNIVSYSTLVNVGDDLNDILNDFITVQSGSNQLFLNISVDEITNLPSQTLNFTGTAFAVVYSTAIFSINY